MELPYSVLSRSESDTENAGGMLADYINVLHDKGEEEGSESKSDKQA